MGTLRLRLNADYDRIQELANQHHWTHALIMASTDSSARPHWQVLSRNIQVIGYIVRSQAKHKLREQHVA